MTKGSKPNAAETEAAASFLQSLQISETEAATATATATATAEQRDLEDLWEQVLSMGTDWDQFSCVSECKWDFSNLKSAFEKGGLLYGKKVYLFSVTQPHMPLLNGPPSKIICIPAVVAIVSPSPPSDKIAVKSLQRESTEIVDIKRVDMDWVPLENRGASLKSQIYILRWTGLKRLNENEYCVPYIDNPFKEDDEIERITIVPIVYPTEPVHVACHFNWELDELEGFTEEMITEEMISKDEKEAFKEFVREKVRERKRAIHEATEKRKKAQEELSQEKVAMFKNMKVYKFYPVVIPEDACKSPFINRFYGEADEVF